MNLAWLVKSSTIWIALMLSGTATVSVLFLNTSGLTALRKRQAELHSHKLNLQGLSRQNKALYDEVRLLDSKDPELMEALVRRMGYDRPGEKVYVFGDSAATR